MTKWCKWYCFPNATEEEKRKVCKNPNCNNKARAELLENLDKKAENYQKLQEVEKNLY